MNNVIPLVRFHTLHKEHKLCVYPTKYPNDWTIDSNVSKGRMPSFMLSTISMCEIDLYTLFSFPSYSGHLPLVFLLRSPKVSQAVHLDFTTQVWFNCSKKQLYCFWEILFQCKGVGGHCLPTSKVVKRKPLNLERANLFWIKNLFDEKSFYFIMSGRKQLKLFP